MAHSHSHSHSSHSHSHPHSSPSHSHNLPHNPYPITPQKQEDECNHCEEEGGCSKNNKQSLANLISRSKAANLARINLFQAIETGDLPLVHYLVTRAVPMSIRTLDAEGNTPLHASARSGHVDLILYFVDQGMPVDLENQSGHTPLMIALSYGQIAATSILIKIGADVNKKDQLGFSPVIHAAQFGNVFSFHHFVSNASVDINDVDHDGHTVLCWACYSGHKELLEYLLSEHCPAVPHMGILDGKKRTPLHWAASQNSTEVCSYLAVSRCKLCSSSSSREERTKEEQEGEKEKGEMTCEAVTGREMLDMRDEDGKTPADCAKAKGHEALAQALELERTGIRATVPEVTPKKDNSEAQHQFLSAFVPFAIVMFLVVPYMPWWGVLAGWFACAAPHARGIKWSIKGRTLVPAGLLSATISGIVWGYIQMNSYYFMSTFSMMVMSLGSLAFLYAYYLIIYADPGIISPSDGFYKRVLDTVASGAEPPAEYCKLCKIIKPPRSKHCRDCNACIDRFDHHCYWIANCVGKKNTRAFYLILLYCIAVIVAFQAYSVSFFITSMDPEIHTVWEGTGFIATQFPQIFWMDMWLIVVLCPVVALTTFHTNLIARDATTYETMTKFRGTPGGGPKLWSILRIIAFLQHGTRIFGSGVPDSPASPASSHV